VLVLVPGLVRPTALHPVAPVASDTEAIDPVEATGVAFAGDDALDDVTVDMDIEGADL